MTSDLTSAEIQALLPLIPREEKEMLLRLTQNEREVILEIYRQFPGVYRDERVIEEEAPKPKQLGPDDPFPEGF